MSARLDDLLRWEAGGGHWEIARDDGQVLELALRTCIGGEVVGSLRSDDDDVRAHVAGRPRDD